MPLVSRPELTAAIARGCVASFPTDTVAAFAARPGAADRIFKTKQRQPDKPLILMGGAAGQLWPYVRGAAAELKIWQDIAARHWPGALTLVLPSSEKVPREMNPKTPGSIGIRVPDCATAREIIRKTSPLATTSANRSGEPALADPVAIAAAFPEAFVLDEAANWAGSGLPSTVVRWRDGGWEVLRQGAIEIR
ncbi:MAG: L-threonylcarbamoyladenylate synthase [Geitlerinemataceae cyanobacterium]